MKAIISHDVDHLTVWEHYRDLIIPKFILRQCFELLVGGVSPTEFSGIIIEFIKNKWQNLDELMQFDKEFNVPATYFVGVNNGLGLAYSIQQANYWIRRIRNNGFDVGVHGIIYDDIDGIKREFNAFKELANSSKFGVRNHYLRMSKDTLRYFEQVGYSFDSSLQKLEGPDKVGNLYEFPLHIMDVSVMYSQGRRAAVDLACAQDHTKRLIDKHFHQHLPYLTILFHDRYFCKGFSRWRDWYIWLINYLIDSRIPFTSYSTEINELKNQSFDAIRE